MSFDVSAEAYQRFMGRFSEPLAVQFVGLVGAQPGQRALDVGCGPGALTAVLAERLGERHVSAIDPSASFVSAIAERLPTVDVHQGTAEHLPFSDASFDIVMAQLVVHFMRDPQAGLAEMARVTKRGGVVAANVWDHGGGSGPLSLFWRAVGDLDPDVPGESDLPGVREGQLVALLESAGLRRPEQSTLTLEPRFETFDDWWDPYTFGVGPAGAYLGRLDDNGRARVRARCLELLPPAPFTIRAKAWCVVAHR